MSMVEGSELTHSQREFKLDLLLLNQKYPEKADLYYHQELKERNRLRKKEGRSIGLEEKRAIYDAIVKMSKEEVEAQIQLIGEKRRGKEKKIFTFPGTGITSAQLEKSARGGGFSTHAAYTAQALEEKEE